MDIVYLIIGFFAVGALFYGLYYLLDRTSRNDDATHGGGFSDSPTGGYGPE